MLMLHKRSALRDPAQQNLKTKLCWYFGKLGLWEELLDSVTLARFTPTAVPPDCHWQTDGGVEIRFLNNLNQTAEHIDVHLPREPAYAVASLIFPLFVLKLCHFLGKTDQILLGQTCLCLSMSRKRHWSGAFDFLISIFQQ